MRRAVVKARRCAMSAVLFCVATGPATAQQFQALDVLAQADEPVRLASEDARQAWASAEPDAEDLCERAKASKEDYIPIWREEFLKRNVMTGAYFDEHVRVIDTTVQCWQSGATFRIASSTTPATTCSRSRLGRSDRVPPFWGCGRATTSDGRRDVPPACRVGRDEHSIRRVHSALAAPCSSEPISLSRLRTTSRSGWLHA